jgi:aryl-phospho-beta-D-glucosidase BglC (GH1 family)
MTVLRTGLPSHQRECAGAIPAVSPTQKKGFFMTNDFVFDVNDSQLIIYDSFAGRQSRMGFSFSFYGITHDVICAYLDSVTKHITYVRQACQLLNIDRYQQREHDCTKFSHEELFAYARNFHGDKGDPDGFAVAWLHHVHFNEHHWQHWIFPDGFTPKGSSVENGVVFMPEQYVKEMVADWMGASLCYTGEWDMSKWLGENLPKIKLHSRSWAILKDTLRPLGYHSIIDELLVNGMIP